MSADAPRPRRPAYLSPASFDDIPMENLDPAVVTHIAHETASVLVHTGRSLDDPELTERLVSLVDEIGLAAVANLWSRQGPRSLPGALWRLYVIREWVRRHPREAALDYQRGLPFAEVANAVAGVAEPPGPDEVCEVVDDILRGVFTSDLSVALHRASAFCRVVSSGRASQEPVTVAGDQGAASARHARHAASMAAMAEDLDACGRLWRQGALT